jgi:hypothetical protein
MGSGEGINKSRIKIKNIGKLILTEIIRNGLTGVADH